MLGAGLPWNFVAVTVPVWEDALVGNKTMYTYEWAATLNLSVDKY
jgi:hypothetical protein